MVGIQIHSVDNNAAVPWEYYPNADDDLAAGQFAVWMDGALTNAYVAMPDAPLYILMAGERNAIGEIPAVHIRDDMVLEGYVVDSEEVRVMLGEIVCVYTGRDKDGLTAGVFAPEEIFPEYKSSLFEVVGIITDCDTEYIDMNGSGNFFVPLTKKVLVRLVK